MRTTLRVDDELPRGAKTHAVRQGRSLTSVFEEALRRLLAESEAREVRMRGRAPGIQRDRGGVRVPGGCPDHEDYRAWLDDTVNGETSCACSDGSGCEWVTTDRDFARLPGLRWRHPLRE